MVLSKFAFSPRPQTLRVVSAADLPHRRPPLGWPVRAVRQASLMLCASAVLATGAACQEGPPGDVAGAELRRLAGDPLVERFYSARGWSAAWGEREARALTEALEAAPRHGLNAQPFLEMIVASEDPARRDAGLTQAALAYAKALAHGVVDPNSLHDIFELERNNVDVVAGLAQALERGEVADWLASLPPQDAEYQALSRAYLAARADPAPGGGLEDGPLIRPGGSDARLPAIARHLQARGYLDEAADPETYGPDLVAAVRKLQTEAGLKPDGIIGPATLKALGAGSAERARQLAVNLERRRWLARRPPATRIDVNTAWATLAYVDNGAVAWSGRTVVGEKKRATPMLQDSFRQLVVNPPWNVPQRIAAEEILPKGAGYLRRNNMVVQDGRVIQRPGPDAALGLVKFDMQNEYAIYLHDTPAKALFATDRRHRSHGCVRVEKAVEFARFLAERYGAANFEDALASGETTVVELTAELPVRLLYHSAVLGPDGRILLGPDPYGWDARLAQAMGLGGGEGAASEAESAGAVELGP
ncbi:murein L,D-transpeptidase [Phenylobacterium terrae]|uniref:Murein L,D-transpeptidase n=1 Tax=Phenylobacterium terrae TaxID=2665495 RepID=A0ABW4N3X1_9CAUL